MNTDYFKFLRDIYSSSKLKTFFADENLNIFWANSPELEIAFKGKSALTLFEEETPLPLRPGFYTCSREGVSCCFNVIAHEGDPKIFIIETVSENTVLDLIKIKPVMDYYSNIEAKIRQSVFGISNAAGLLYETLEATESYNEIEMVNLQMRDCYRILKAIKDVNEISKYVYGVSNRKIFNVSLTLEEAKRNFDSILGSKKSCIRMEIEQDLFVDADEERFINCLLEIMLHVIKNSEGIPSIRIIAKKVAGDVLIAVTGGNCEIAEISEKYCAFGGRGDYPSGYFSLDLYLIKLFCQTFDAKLYVVSGEGMENTIGLRMHGIHKNQAEKISTELKTESKDYSENKFSPYHINFADVYNYNFFDR